MALTAPIDCQHRRSTTLCSVYGPLHKFAVLANTLDFKQLRGEITLENTNLQRLQKLSILPLNLPVQVVKPIAVAYQIPDSFGPWLREILRIFGFFSFGYCSKQYYCCTSCWILRPKCSGFDPTAFRYCTTSFMSTLSSAYLWNCFLKYCTTVLRQKGCK